MRNGAVLPIFVLLVAILILSGCTGSQSPLQQTSTKHYGVGDVVTLNDTDDYGAIILDYNQSMDQYLFRVILQKKDGSWGYYLPDFEAVNGKRASLDANFTTYAGHVSDPTSIKTIDYSNPPNDISHFIYETTPKPTIIQSVSIESKFKAGDVVTEENFE